VRTGEFHGGGGGVNLRAAGAEVPGDRGRGADWGNLRCSFFARTCCFVLQELTLMGNASMAERMETDRAADGDVCGDDAYGETVLPRVRPSGNHKPRTGARVGVTGSTAAESA